MPSAPPPRRPRPGPGRPAAVPVARAEPAVAPLTVDRFVAGAAIPVDDAPRPGVIVVGDERIRVPGLAGYLRRHPKLTQRGGIAAVAGGVVLFVVAGLTTPLAGANTAEPPAGPGSASATVDVSDSPTVAAATPATEQAGDPTEAKKQAPADHGVISGLAANGIPKVALNAYRVAAARLADVQPACGIDWALLAGIGREESDHGRFGGAVLHADGVSTPRIIGPALDGVHWDYIPAPADGLALVGDATYAHALGPMQFIPSTWAIYGADATGDGKADVFNINDAALGAARYLCAAGGNLRTRAGQVAAVLAYNHNDEYLAQVLALADAYRRGIAITGLPVGITTGPLPKVTDTGYIPPANPGAPTAVGKVAEGDKGGRGDNGGAGTATSSPKPRGSTSSAPAPSTTGRTTSRPAPGTGTAPKPSATSSSPNPGGPASTSSTAAPSPTPTATKTCTPLEQVFGCKG